jgi:hypothetical protein
MTDVEADEARTEEIKRRQRLLFDAFRHNGVTGGRYFAPVIDAENAIGAKFIDTYYGHRLLTDCFLDFFGGTLLKQIELNNKVGWPKEDEYYATCLLMFLTIFRSIRASDLASVHAYPLQGYIIQRSIKDQAFVLCAAASGIARFGALFGWEGLPEGEKLEDHQELIIKNRRKIEGKIKDRLIGVKSDLKPETRKLLLNLDQMFNLEAHRGLLSLFSESHSVMVEHKLDISLAPPPKRTGWFTASCPTREGRIPPTIRRGRRIGNYSTSIFAGWWKDLARSGERLLRHSSNSLMPSSSSMQTRTILNQRSSSLK